jgi:hypothetical protein
MKVAVTVTVKVELDVGEDSLQDVEAAVKDDPYLWMELDAAIWTIEVKPCE